MDKKDELEKQREIWRLKRLADRKKFYKDERIYLRVTANEKAYMKYMAERIDPSMTLTDYIIESSLYGELNQIDLKYLNELTTAINQLGNNVNQIARRINIEAKKGSLSEDHILESFSILKSYQHELVSLNQLTEKYYRKIKSTLAQKNPHSYDPDVDYGDLEYE